MVLGCHDDIIPIKCSADGSSNITIKSAIYGLYDDACPALNECCAPNPLYDCVEDMNTVTPTYFELIQYNCDGKHNCSTEITWDYVMYACGGEFNFDYVQIFFECSSVVEGPIAFMVQNLKREDLNIHEIVPWLNVITNFDGHYYPETYSFVCPVHGVYMFSVVILTINDYIRIDVLQNEKQLFEVHADGEYDFYDMSSSLGVIECEAGDVVLAVVDFGGSFALHSSNVHAFSGFLLNKL